MHTFGMLRLVYGRRRGESKIGRRKDISRNSSIMRDSSPSWPWSLSGWMFDMSQMSHLRLQWLFRPTPVSAVGERSKGMKKLSVWTQSYT